MSANDNNDRSGHDALAECVANADRKYREGQRKDARRELADARATMLTAAHHADQAQDGPLHTACMYLLTSIDDAAELVDEAVGR